MCKISLEKGVANYVVEDHLNFNSETSTRLLHTTEIVYSLEFTFFLCFWSSWVGMPLFYGEQTKNIQFCIYMVLCGSSFERGPTMILFFHMSLTYLLTYNLASLSGPNSARARAQLTLSLMKQFRSNSLTLSRRIGW